MVKYSIFSVGSSDYSKKKLGNMVVKCIVDTCNNCRGKKSNEMQIILHELPSNFVLRELSITAVNESVCGLRKGMRCIGDSAAICSDHFTEASYSIRNGKKILNGNNTKE
jgi:hypothetical protein